MDDIYSALKNNQQQAAQAASGLSDIYLQISSIADELVNTAQAGLIQGETKESFAAKEIGALELQNKKQQFSQSLNNGEGFEAFNARLTQQLVEAVNQRNTAAEIVRQKESVGLFDDPLGFLFNQLTIDDDYAALKGADQKVQAASSGLQAINAQMQHTSQTFNEYAITRTAAATDSKIAAFEQELKAKGLGARIQALQTNAHGIEAVFRMNEQQLDAAFKLHQIAVADENRAEARDDRTLRKMMLQEKLQELQDKEEGKQFKVQAIRYALEREGTPTEIAAAQVNTGNVDRLLTDAVTKKRYGTLYELGTDALANNGVVRYGNSPTEVLMTMQSLKLQPRNEVQKTLVDLAFNADKAAAMQAGKDMNARVASSSELYVKTLKAKQSAIDPKDGSNPYQAPPLSVLAQSEAVKNSALYQKVFAPQIAAGVQDTNDATQITNQAIAAAKAGTITFAELDYGLKNFYSAAVRLNSEQNQYEKFGAPDQIAFRAKLPIAGPNTAGLSSIVDLTNDEARKMYLLRRLTMSKLTSGSINWGGEYGQYDKGFYPPLLTPLK